jgi:hypothetical protein
MQAEKYVSLGFSCQSRYTLATLSADHRGMPFDWSITTRQFVLESLQEGDGRGFTPAPDELKIYQMPNTGAEGLGSDRGIWFWHDFPRGNDLKLAANWRTASDFPQKYIALWERFLKCIRDPGQRKRFVVSNTQENLDQFWTSLHDFQFKFGLDFSYASKLFEVLVELGTKNFEIEFLIRNIDDYIDLVGRPEIKNFHPKFVGPLALPTHNIVANSLLYSVDIDAISHVRELAGQYDNGAVIVPVAYNSAMIYDANKNCQGVAYDFPGGFIFCFMGGVSKVFRAVIDNNCIYFENKSRWRKLNA